MALAFSTLVVLILLLPGILAVPGIYASDRLSRDVVPQGLLAQLAIFIIVATLVHFAFYLAINRLLAPLGVVPPVRLDIVLSFASLGSIAAATASSLANNIEENAAWIGLYLVATSATGYGLGYSFGKAILKGVFRFVATNSWLYDAVTATHRKTDRNQVLAYVLTSVEHEGTRIIYYGIVHHCQFSADGKLTYVVLSSPRRGLLKLKQESVCTAGSDGSEEWHALEKSVPNAPAAPEKRSNLLFIDGEQVVNVFFTTIPWSIQAGDLERLQQKAAEIRKEGESGSIASQQIDRASDQHANIAQALGL